METKKSVSHGPQDKAESKQRKAELRREKRRQLLEQSKGNKWKSYALGTVFFFLDLFD